jgi:hypothetical protein
MANKLCRAFYILAHDIFLPPPWSGKQPLAFVVHRVKAHNKDILFVVRFPPAHGNHIPLSCVFKCMTKYF